MERVLRKWRNINTTKYQLHNRITYQNYLSDCYRLLFNHSTDHFTYRIPDEQAHFSSVAIYAGLYSGNQVGAESHLRVEHCFNSQHFCSGKIDQLSHQSGSSHINGNPEAFLRLKHKLALIGEDQVIELPDLKGDITGAPTVTSQPPVGGKIQFQQFFPVSIGNLNLPFEQLHAALPAGAPAPTRKFHPVFVQRINQWCLVVDQQFFA
jgi:hypothetical protein